MMQWNSPASAGKAAPGSEPEVSERGEAQVYRRRSLQSRISDLLPVGIVLVLGVALLGGYYGHVAGRPVPAARLHGSGSGTGEDVPLPSLGHIDPPAPAVPLEASPVGAPSLASVTASAPLPPAVLLPASAQSPTPGQAPAAARSPTQAALDRQLSGPAFAREEHASSGVSGTAATAVAGATGMPGSAVMAPPQGQGAFTDARADAHAGAANAGLADLLVPTATPSVRARELPTQRLLLAKGTFIDCTLETAIDSSLPGMTTCITATDTFSVDGKVVLLERGSKLVGETRGQVQQGASRLFVLWTEARAPSGVVVPLASPGTDELGRAGMSGEVERHFWQRFGAAILISVIDGGLQAAARSGSGSVIYDTSSSRDVATEALRSSVGIAPTLIKPQGDRIQVLVARDLDFRSVYDLKGTSGARP